MKYSPNGNHRKSAGFVINYYCPECVMLGITAEIVAIILKRTAPKRGSTKKPAV